MAGDCCYEPMSTYVLLIDGGGEVTVGALGRFRFPKGRYLYVGSAKRGMDHRLARHLRREKPARWHVDYLTVDPRFQVVEAWTLPRAAECAAARKALKKGRVIVPRMGASDCRCPAHFLAVDGSWEAVRGWLSDGGFSRWTPPPSPASGATLPAPGR